MAADRRILAKKLIRAAHAKEKQLLEKSRNRPNRPNLLDSTVCSSPRSNFFTKNSCLVISGAVKLSNSTEAIAPETTCRLAFTEDLLAQQLKLGLLRRAPPEEAT